MRIMVILHWVSFAFICFSASFYYFVSKEEVATAQRLHREAETKRQEQVASEAEKDKAKAAAAAEESVRREKAKEEDVRRKEDGIRKSLDEAFAALRELHKDDYAKSDPAAMRAFSHELFAKVCERGIRPRDLYVLLHEARECASKCGELGIVLTVNEIFDVARNPQFDPAARNPQLDQSTREFMEIKSLWRDPNYIDGFRIVISLCAGDEKVERGRLFERLSSSAEDPEVASAARAFHVLTTHPNDPSANLIAGKHSCFVLGNWGVGLPLLATGADQELGALASADLGLLRLPGTDDDKAFADTRNVAERWCAYADKNTGSVRIVSLARARFWYEAARDVAPRLVLEKIEERARELGRLQRKEEAAILGTEKETAISGGDPLVHMLRHGLYSSVWDDIKRHEKERPAPSASATPTLPTSTTVPDAPRPPSEQPPVPQERVATAPEVAKRAYTCVSCKKSLQAMPGTEAKCPHCGKLLKFPAEPSQVVSRNPQPPTGQAPAGQRDQQPATTLEVLLRLATELPPDKSGGKPGAIARVTVRKFVDGAWEQKDYSVKRGDKIGQPETIQREGKPVQVDFSTRWEVVDISRVERTTKVPVKESKFDERGRKVGEETTFVEKKVRAWKLTCKDEAGQVKEIFESGSPR